MGAGSGQALSTIAPPQPGPEQQDAPLTEDERKLVARLFSDPTYFPLEFRTWLKAYIEGGGLTFPASSIVGGVGKKVINLPVGAVIGFAAASSAANVLPCDGREVLVSDYKELAEFLGITWGTPSAPDKVLLPDYRDRTLFGAGSVVGLGATDGKGIGSRGGPFHKHYFNQTSGSGGAHSHGVSVSGGTSVDGTHQHNAAVNFAYISTTAALGSGGTVRNIVGGSTPDTNGAGSHSHSFSGSGGTDGAGDHNHNVQGDTSGGYDYDHPSFAGALYYIVAS